MREESIFVSALEMITPAERAAYLTEACAGEPELRRRVNALLLAHEQSGDLLDPPAAVRPMAEGPGTRIGPYKLLQSIGEGGMGVVFLAEQESPVRRKVALKVIKPGMDTALVIARFEAERQALAILDHNNIAKVFDAGTTDSGRPYFVMELVEGVPITEYCDRNRLTTQARLELFIQVCQAIQHAHQKGIIHRDVKPSNVLVALHDDTSVPKVIDFGVAKAIDQRLTERTLFTQFGMMIGTPEYMSPEQSRMGGMDIDTRSDIYSLGVLLYELLTGSTPLESRRLRAAAFTDVLRRIREEEPPTPSTRLGTTEQTAAIAAQRGTEPAKLAKLVRGELDWIVMKALEKDRTRRYDSAGGMARDIKRHLDGDPVEAGPPSAFYRMSTLVRKHRMALATATAFVVLLMMAAIVSTWQAVRATRAEASAAVNLAKARKGEESARRSESEWEAMVGFFRDKILAAVRPRGQDGGLGRDVKLRDAIEHAEASIADRFADQPKVEARIRDAIGLSYAYLGEVDREIPQLERARELFEAKLGLEHSDTLVAMSSLANAYNHAGRPNDAIPLFERTIPLMDHALGPEHLYALATRNNLAGIYSEIGRLDEAIKLHEHVLASMKAKAGPENIDTLSSMNNLANAYRNAGRTAEAVTLHEQALDLMKTNLEPNHPNLLNCMSNLAIDYSEAGRLADSIALQEKALALKLSNPGPDHPDTLRTKNSLARTYQKAGRTADAIRLFEEGLKAAQAKLPPAHPVTLMFMDNVASAYLNAKRWADAENSSRECLNRRAAANRPENWAKFCTMSQLGAALAGQKKYAEAEPLLIGGYEGIKEREARIPAPAKKELAACAARVVPFDEAWGKADKAAQWRSKLSPHEDAATPKL